MPHVSFNHQPAMNATRSPHTMGDMSWETSSNIQPQESAVPCLAYLVSHQNVETDKWNAYMNMHIIARLITTKRTPQTDICLRYKGQDVIIKSHIWGRLKTFLKHRVADYNRGLDLDGHITILKLIGHWFGSYEVARMATLVWEMSVAVMRKKLPLPPDPATLHVFFRVSPFNTIEQLVWAWKFVLMRIQDTTAACGSYENACRRYPRFPDR